MAVIHRGECCVTSNKAAAPDVTAVINSTPLNIMIHKAFKLHNISIHINTPTELLKTLFSLLYT